MANATDTIAHTVHGKNPQFLMERIVREKVYDTQYWKESCFAQTEATIVDRASDQKYVAGTTGVYQKPSEFLCLTLKLLQIQPMKDCVYEYIHCETFKYLRLLGAFYLRLVGRPKEIYTYLEPLLCDRRKVVEKDHNGKAFITHIDEIIDRMLTNERLFNIALPKLPTRRHLENLKLLSPYTSVLTLEFEAVKDVNSDHASNTSDTETVYEIE